MLVTARRRLVVRIFLSALLLLAGPASAQQMFKWVDEKGVTHFSVTPPPVEQVAPDAVEEQSLKGRSDRGSYLSGTWWDQTPAHRGDYLELRGGEFEIGRRYISQGSNRKTEIASGPYLRDANALVLTYFTHLRDSSLLDQSERFSILRLEDTEMELLKPGHQAPALYRRLKSTSSSLFSVRIKGRWSVKEKPGLIYEFNNGTYEVLSLSRGSDMTLRRGNWVWEDPNLVLKPVMNLSAGGDGRDDRWYVSGISTNEITVVDQADNNSLTLLRSR